MRRILIAIALAAILPAGYWVLVAGLSQPGESSSRPVERPPVPVRVARAEARVLPVFVRGLGHVVPNNSVQLRSRVDGQIDRVLFAEGQEVKAGEPLVLVDPRPYQAMVAQAEGQLARDQAQLTAARADLDRSRSLLAKGFASRQTFDQQTAAAAQLAGAAATDQAALDAARLNLSFTTIRAPISGRIGKRLIDAGNVVHASDPQPLAEIVQVHPIAVLLTVPQSDLPAIRARQAAGRVAIEAWSPDDQHELATGQLVLIGNEIDQATASIELKAEFANSDDSLWPGQFVNARVVTEMRENAVAVPMAAVQPGADGRFVYVVDAQQTVRPQPVKLGVPVPGMAIVEEGLAPGATVVVDNQDQLAPGSKVSITGWVKELPEADRHAAAGST